MKINRFALAGLGLACLAIVVTRRTVPAAAQQAMFSPNQELPLPLTAGNLPVQFIVRGLEPSNRTDSQGTIHVSSIRGVPGGVDLHRWSPLIDPPPNADGALPFAYLGQPDNCGIFADGCNNIGIAEGGGDVDIAVNAPAPRRNGCSSSARPDGEAPPRSRPPSNAAACWASRATSRGRCATSRRTC